MAISLHFRLCLKSAPLCDISYCLYVCYYSCLVCYYCYFQFLV